MASKKTGARSDGGFTIVVGIDYTAAGDAALGEAIAAAAGRSQASLHVVHALDTALEAKTASGIRKLDALIDKAAARLKGYLDKARASELGEREIIAHVRLSSPETAIVQLAVDVDADLVVVGTTKRKGVAKLVHSSVSSKVLKHAECPVLLVRKKNHAGMAKTPRIQPVCPACRALRAKTNGAEWWCERHRAHAVLPAHVYHYHRELSLRSEVPPGGT
jgi:nucleotide-binding universal stress UspA family protein